MTMTDVSAEPTFRSTRGRCPVFRPLLNGEEFPVTFTEVIAALGENIHDSMVMGCISTELTDTEGILDSTISFVYGQAPRAQLFNGYIIGVTGEKKGESTLTFSIAVMGATQVMQKGRPRFWTSKSIPNAVESLSFSNNLGFSGHQHPYLWQSLAQTNESDWQQSVSLAGRIGWSIYSRHGVVLCHNSSALFSDEGSYATLRSAQDHDFDVEEHRRMIDFTANEQSSEIPENMGTKLAYFTDNGTVQVTTETGEFRSYKYSTNQVIRNAEEAAFYANKGQSQVDGWKQSADARIWGDTDIYPGMLVDVVTTNPRFFRDKFDGRWLVQSVKHAMDTNQFQTQLRLRRDDPKAHVSPMPYVSFWETAKKARPSLSIRDKVWVSSWSSPEVSSSL